MIDFRKVLITSTAVLALFTVSVDGLSAPLTTSTDAQPIAGLDTAATERQLFELSEVLLQDPQNPQLLLQKGIYLSNLGRLQAAFDIFDALRVAFPEQVAPYVNLAVIYARWGKLEEARDMLMKSSALENNRLQTHLSLASVNIGLALESLGEALKISPGDTVAQAKRQALEKYIAETDKITADAGIQSGTAALKNSGATERRKENPAHNRARTKQKQAKKPTGDRLKLDNLDDLFNEDRSASSTTKNAASVPENGPKADVLAALQSWVKAWRSKSYDSYTSHYSTAFAPADGTNIEAWRQRKKVLLETAKFIQVDIHILDVQFDGPVATVRLQQTYQSDRYSDQTRKDLQLRLEEGRWKLLSEKTSN